METTNDLMPGVDVVGRGLLLRPHRPYELRQVLFRRADLRRHSPRDCGQTFTIPDGYAIDESPPTPEGVALSTVTIEHSWERFQSERSLDASVASGLGSFNLSATASHGNSLRSEQDSYYGIRSSFVSLWSVYLEDPTSSAVAFDTSDIPTPYDPAHRQRYEAFFQRYGSHFTKRAWVGGKADIIVSIAKSSSLSKSDIQAGLSAGMGGASDAASAKSSNSRAQLVSNSRCTVLGRGGEEIRLAAMSSLDEASYTGWVQTIRDNPQTVEIEVAGIWTLIRAEQPEVAEALMRAYKMASSFEPVSGIVSYDDIIYFLRGRHFFTYDREDGDNEESERLVDAWPVLDDVGFDRIDAAFRYEDSSVSADSGQRRVHMFRRDAYIELDITTGTLCPGYPKKISDGWPGVTFTKIDAAFSVDPESVYFFAGKEYIRFNPQTGKADEGYPQPIQRRWLGVTLDRIDAAVYWGGGKVYFFRNDQVIRYDIVTMRADPGYPKSIVGNYVEDWNFFD